jgi:AsmA-like C-terminal region
MSRDPQSLVESVTMEQPARGRNSSLRRHRKRWFFTGALGAGVVLVVAVLLLALNWPFTRERVITDLAEATSSTVAIAHFKKTYFPHPGCIAEGVDFRRDRNPQTIPLITIQKLTIAGSFTGLLRHRVPLMRADGMLVLIPPLGSDGGWPQHQSESKTVIGEFVANGATLEFERREPGQRPLVFAIHEFSIADLGSRNPMRFQTALLNPEPPGEVRASGHLGPWSAQRPSQTPISGSYSFQRADLDVFKGIGGILSSEGKFQGTLTEMEVQGATLTPEFEVTRSGHKFRLTTTFQAEVNGRNGDVVLRDVNAHFWNTTVSSAGNIEGHVGEKGKTASLELAVREGHIEDILFLFVRKPRAPLTGIVNFTANTTIPPGQRPFLRKVELEGDFGIDRARFTSSKTQRTMEKLSERAQGKKKSDLYEDDPESLVSDLRGHVVLKDGTASFSNLSFTVPGALVRLHGTYDLISERIDLHGTLQMQAKLSQVTSGVKSFLIKALDPFLKRDHPRARVPISIAGTYSHPSYKVSTSSKQSKQ